MTKCEWIGTGEAARLAGYSRQHFLVKFKGIIPSRCVAGGYRRWDRKAIEKLVTDSEDSELSEGQKMAG